MGDTKKILPVLLIMVLGLFMVGTARADGAWVLWQHIISNEKSEWWIEEAFPTYDLCKKSTMHVAFFMHGEEAKKINDHQFSISDGTMIEWICFPESVDPRK